MSHPYKALDQWPLTKQVVICRFKDEKFAVSWHDGWNIEKHCWESRPEGDWKHLPASCIDSYMLHSIEILLDTGIGIPPPAHITPDIAINPDIVQLIQLVSSSLSIVSGVRLLLCWKLIMELVIEQTDDALLRIYVEDVYRRIGIQHAEQKEKTKTDERHGKGVSTKAKIKLRKPWTKHIIAGYEEAKKKHPIKRGITSAESFWDYVIYYTDDARLNDFDIKFHGEDKLFIKGKEIDYLPWGIKWKSARNEIRKLKEKGRIKE